MGGGGGAEASARSQKDKALGWQAIVHKQCLPPPPPNALYIFRTDRHLGGGGGGTLIFLPVSLGYPNHESMPESPPHLKKSR